MNQLNKNKISFAFFGTPYVAEKTLESLISSGYMPSIVITSPDKPAGRGLQLQKTPVKILAEKYNIPVFTPEKIDSDFISKIKEYKLDLFIVVAYGKILSQEFIDIPKYGTINIHYSLLPKYRGASPVEEAILNGDKETGVCIQKMRFKLDSGPIIASEKIEINILDSKKEIFEKLIGIGSNLLIQILPDFLTGNIKENEQDENLATKCRKIKKENGEINLKDGDLKNWNKYRAYHGWPGVFFFKDGKRIKITKANFLNGKFIIEKVIPEGKKEQDYLL